MVCWLHQGKNRNCTESKWSRPQPQMRNWWMRVPGTVWGGSAWGGFRILSPWLWHPKECNIWALHQALSHEGCQEMLHNGSVLEDHIAGFCHHSRIFSSTPWFFKALDINGMDIKGYAYSHDMLSEARSSSGPFQRRWPDQLQGHEPQY